MSIRARVGYTMAAGAFTIGFRWWAIPIFLAWKLTTSIGRTIRLLPRHPVILAALTAATTITYINYLLLPAAIFLTLIALWLWQERHPASYHRHITPRLRGWKRAHRRYRWGQPNWRKTLSRCHVAKDGVPLPWLISVRSTPHVDKLRIKVPTGHDETAFQDFRGDLLRWGWRAQSVRVFNPQTKTQTLELWNLIDDPLTETVQPFQHSTEALPKKGLALAKIEDGETWYWKIQGGPAHMLTVGISGSGKGSVIGAILDATEQGRQQRIIECWGIDLQASELGMSEHLFAKLAYNQPDAAVMLEALVGVMNRRTRSMFGITRQHHPSEGDPFCVLVIDEGLILLDKVDRALYRRIDSALSALLRGARKASIAVVMMSQRAELEIIGPRRKDFPIAVALQQNPTQPEDVNMVLGRG